MDAYRHILNVLPASPVEMGGLRVRQPLPHVRQEHIDPFLLLHHAGPIHFQGGGRQRRQGVPPHPHRGFEPVTFIYHGGVHHRDSLGNDSVVYAGGVQWTTAGHGVVHSERPPRELIEAGGAQELIQLWINLPGRHKLTPPRYQHFEAHDMPHLGHDNGSVSIRLVAGDFEGQTGPVDTYTPLLALNATFRAGARYHFALPRTFNAFFYLLNGNGRVNDTRAVNGMHLVHFARDADAVAFEATAPTRLLLMAGTPLHEPVSTYGPFVMNSQREVLQAMQDYQAGKMGHLVEHF